MSDTASSPDDGPARGGRLLLAGWGVFAAVNAVLMWYFPGGETIPFHFIWISIALVFGMTPMSRPSMNITLGLVTAVTAVILVHHAVIGEIGVEETTEVPLMALVFLVMVWHVNRRQQAMAELRRLAATERRVAENQRLFVRSASHELRTPVTVARGYVELIRSAHTDPQTAEDTGIVLEELGKLDALTARLVTLAALEHPTVLAEVDLDAVLDKTVRRWSPVAERDWRAVGDVGVVLADGDRVETMLDCLVENAVTFTVPGDRIELGAHRADGMVVLTVADTGEGIPPHDLPHVFERFRSGSTAGERAGSGLGLAIAQAVVAARGGQLAVTSTLGRGTTFTARIPEVPHAPVPFTADRSAARG